MSKVKCQACGDTGMVGVYLGDGEFEFYPCEWCSVYNDQHRPTPRATDKCRKSPSGEHQFNETIVASECVFCGTCR